MLGADIADALDAGTLQAKMVARSTTESAQMSLMVGRKTLLKIPCARGGEPEANSYLDRYIEIWSRPAQYRSGQFECASPEIARTAAEALAEMFRAAYLPLFENESQLWVRVHRTVNLGNFVERFNGEVWAPIGQYLGDDAAEEKIKQAIADTPMLIRVPPRDIVTDAFEIAK